MPQYSVRVVNAAGNTISRTTPKKAIEMLKRGTARARGSAIELIEGDHRVSAPGCVTRKEREGIRVIIEGDGYAPLKAVEGLPVAGEAIRVFIGHRPTVPPRHTVAVEVERRFYVQAF